LTWTPTATLSPTRTGTASFTFTYTSTSTLVPTNTFTPTHTPVPTATFTPTFTPTMSSGCSGVPAWNGNFVYYAIGAKVTYNNELYQCIQDHTSESTWEPTVTPALWEALGPCSVTNVVVYPNPSTSSGQVRLSLPLTATSDVTVAVYTVGFRKIEQKTFPQVAVGSDLTMDLTDQWGGKFANGLYYFMVNAQGHKWISKLLVVH
jgi:hypothetical protein